MDTEVTPGATLTPFKAEVVRIGLQKMFLKDGFFDICKLKALIKCAEVQVPSAALDELAPLHCVDWGDMGLEMQRQVFQRVLVLLSMPRMELPELYQPLLQSEGQGAFRGIFNRLSGSRKEDA